MRQIKFRAWSIDNEVMYQPGDEHGTTTDLDCVRYFSEGQNVMLLQFTGLADQNGAEIYEGDVVDVCGHRIAKLEGVGFVYWCEFSAAFRVKSGAARLPHPMDPKILTVIGNIHRQPELLEQPS